MSRVFEDQIPEVRLEPDEIDRLLVDELNELTVTKREQVLEEVHGVSSIHNFPLMDIRLKQMQEELDMHFYSTGDSHGCGDDREFHPHDVPTARRKSSTICSTYREARLKNSSLITDPLFMRGHLLVENLDPKAAAIRMMVYLEHIKQLYETSAVLFRPIFIEDMHMKAREQLATGSFQILQDRDSSGRRVVCYLRDMRPDIDGDNIQHMSQVYLYFKQKPAEEKDGMVMVMFLHNSNLFTRFVNTSKMYERAKDMVKCFPTRYEAIHLCVPNEPFYNVMKSTLMLLMGKENRMHVRIHVGSHLECRYSLSTFGIPVNRLPTVLELNRTLRKDNISYHTKWLKMQKAKELEIKKIHYERCRFDASTDIGMEAVNIFRSEFIECPRYEDCLFGRGRNVMKHPGNVAMRHLLEEKRERYAAAPHQKKSDVAWEVVREIKMGGGRFLKELDSGLFAPVEDEVARKKISIAFRDLKTTVGKRITTDQQRKQLQEQQYSKAGQSSRTAKRQKLFCGHENHFDNLNSSDDESHCLRFVFDDKIP